MNNIIKSKINDLKLEAIDLWLKPTLQEACVSSNDISHSNYKKTIDFKNISDDIRLVGTKKQIDDFWKENKLQVKDSWSCEVTEKHLNGYISNNKNLLLIKLV